MKNLLSPTLLSFSIALSTFTLPAQGQILYCSEARQQGAVFLLNLSPENAAKIRKLAQQGKIRINTCSHDKTGQGIEFVIGEAIVSLIK